MEEGKLVKFLFTTSNGPGHATVYIKAEDSIDSVGEYLLAAFKKMYKDIELTGYETIQKQ